MKHIKHGSRVDGRSRREANRKERGQAEISKMCNRYLTESRLLKTYYVDPEVLKNYQHGQDLKKYIKE